MSVGYRSQAGHLGEAQLFLHATLLIVLVPAIWLGATYLGERYAHASALHEAETNASLYSLTINGLMQQHELIPAVVALCPCIDRLLADPQDRNATAQTNEHLALIAGAVGADTIFLVDADGIAVAASDWNQATSVLGRRFDHRAYFESALRLGKAREITAGANADELGFYVAKRVDSPDTSRRGVIVLRDRMDAMSDYLARSSRVGDARVLALTDKHNIVVAASAPTWVLRPLVRVADRARADLVGRYPRAVLHRIPVIDGVDRIGANEDRQVVRLFDPFEGRYAVYRFPLGNLGISIDVFKPIQGWGDSVLLFRVLGYALLGLGYAGWLATRGRRRRTAPA